MATTLDNQLSQQHDLSHDTLMGLEELDSHLGMFDPALDPVMESPTPGRVSMSPINGTINDFDQESQTIIVDASGESPSGKYHSTPGPESRVKPDDGRIMPTSTSQYVLSPSRFSYF
jgi:hypothetical protein